MPSRTVRVEKCRDEKRNHDTWVELPGGPEVVGLRSLPRMRQGDYRQKERDGGRALAIHSHALKTSSGIACARITIKNSELRRTPPRAMMRLRGSAPPPSPGCSLPNSLHCRQASAPEPAASASARILTM